MEKANAEPMFQSRSNSVLSIDGSAVKALKVACDEFIKNGKDISEFDITISEEANKSTNGADDMLVVTFMGKFLPGKKRGLGTANRVPGSVTYFVSREKSKIIKEQGIK